MEPKVIELKSKLPITLPVDVLEEIVCKSKDYALMNAAAMRSKQNFNEDSLNFAPFVLLPSPFPRVQFQKSVKVQPLLNELVHKVANDKEFIEKALADTIKVDSFTRKLYEIYERMEAEGVTQPISLGLIRSDVMLEGKCCHAGSCKGDCYCFCRKQVEINTIASGFGHLGPASRTIQKYVMQELDLLNENTINNIPENKALSSLCGGMVKAWDMYNSKESVILFVIEDVSYNICDQRFHEFYIRENFPHIKVIRKTLTQIQQQGSIGPNKELLIQDKEVGVVYFRAGYEPGHYPTDKEWDARLLVERSKAIKSPSINYHLAGTKKIQQELAVPGVLKRFFDEEEKINQVQEIFAGLYGLEDDENGRKAVEMALNNPHKFVLKPQREGGMNNVYGEEIADALKKMTLEERKAWILMDRINPPISKGYIVRPGSSELPKPIEMVSELGIFGVIIAEGETIHENHQAGHMLRTKISTANEGGVAAGLGALDSPYLIDDCC